MSDAPDLGPVPTRVPVDADQVRRLVEEQFPQWTGLAIEPVANGGWDNWTFHLGSDLVVRLPSAAEYALALERSSAINWRWTRRPGRVGGAGRWKAGATCLYTYDDPADAEEYARAKRVLDTILYDVAEA